MSKSKNQNESFGSGAPLMHQYLLGADDDIKPLETQAEPIRPDWGHWLKMDVVSIKEACWLLVDVEPRYSQNPTKNFDQHRAMLVETLGFNEVLQVIQASLVSQSLGFIPYGENYIDGQIKLFDFVEWADKKGYEIPVGLRPILDKKQEPETTIGNRHQNESNELAILNQASLKFWANADRDDRTTHPKNEVVAAWLLEKGFSSKSRAKIAASIIRPEWASSGRIPEE